MKLTGRRADLYLVCICDLGANHAVIKELYPDTEVQLSPYHHKIVTIDVPKYVYELAVINLTIEKLES